MKDNSYSIGWTYLETFMGGSGFTVCISLLFFVDTKAFGDPLIYSLLLAGVVYISSGLGLSAVITNSSKHLLLALGFFALFLSSLIAGNTFDAIFNFLAFLINGIVLFFVSKNGVLTNE